MNLVSLILLGAAVAQPPQDVPPFVKNNVQSMMNYYRSPDPTRGPKLLAELLQPENIGHPWLAKNDHVLNILGAQFGDIAMGHPKIVRQYEDLFVGTTPLGRRIILRALTNCGDADTRKKVDIWLADATLADAKAGLETLKKHLADPQRKHTRDVPPRVPGDLDLLWANFFTTGEYAPVARILDVFDRPENDPATATMKRVARWSLGSNLQQHPKLVEVVRAHRKERPEASRKVIDELIITPGGK